MGLRGRLWVDDLRQPPSPTWWRARTADQAVGLLAYFDIFELSLDHDLGGEETTRPVVLWLCEHPDRWPPVVRVHSANPPGRDWLLGMIRHYNPHYARVGV